MLVISCPPRNIVQIPDLPALAEVGDVLSAELGYQSLGKQLDRLAPLLKDESTEVCRRFFLGGGGSRPLSCLVSMDFKGSMETSTYVACSFLFRRMRFIYRSRKMFD